SATAGAPSLSSSSVKPDGRSPRSVIVRRHPQTLEVVRLEARAVLPRHLHFEVPEHPVAHEPQIGCFDPVLRTRGVVVAAATKAFRGRSVLTRGGGLEVRVVEKRVHDAAGEDRRARLARCALLEPEARAADLEAGRHADAEDGPGDGDLEEREPAPAGAPRLHPASSTSMRPSRGSSRMRSRSRLRSARLASTTSAPLVAPFGKQSTRAMPLIGTPSPSARSITARSVSVAHRL